jgi:hypothetical protein
LQLSPLSRRLNKRLQRRRHCAGSSFLSPARTCFQTVSSKRGGAWYARFGRVLNGSSRRTLSVDCRQYQIRIGEGGVRVWVSVFLGEIHTQEKAVTSYILTYGEKVTVRELTDFGVVPFEIKVVGLPPMIGEAPKFVSNARAIELVVMEPIFSTLPSYKLVVRNLSAKTVSALHVQTLQDGRMRNSLMPQRQRRRANHRARRHLEFNARLATRATPTADGYSPVILPDQVIEISSAVFDDGSYEGESETPISFAAVSKGRKVMLEKVLGLLNKFQSANDSAPPQVLMG